MVYGDDPVPDRRPPKREELIRAHMERVAIGEEVERMVESVDTGLSVSELRERLARIRAEISLTEGTASLTEHPEFQALQNDLIVAVKAMKTVHEEYTVAVSRMLASKASYDDQLLKLRKQIDMLKERKRCSASEHQLVIDAVKVRQEPLREEMLVAAAKIEDFCRSIGVPAETFLKVLDEFERPVAKVTRKVYSSGIGVTEFDESLFAVPKMAWQRWRKRFAELGVLIIRDESGEDLAFELTGDQAKLALSKCSLTYDPDMVGVKTE